MPAPTPFRLWSSTAGVACGYFRSYSHRPVRYGQTGVMTFMVNALGFVDQRDLGKNTDEVVAKIMRFNPADKWDVVTE
jgi:hypothetical protein